MLETLRSDDRGVSPVIGVILMVAVTVVLGAVIGAFVFGIGDKLGEPAPNAQINWDYDSTTGDLDVVHDGGDSITVDNTGELDVTGDNGDMSGTNLVVDSASAAPYQSGDTIYSFDGGGPGTEALSSGEVVELQWQSNGGDQSSTLGTFEEYGSHPVPPL